MRMSDPTTDLAEKVAANIITEVFKSSVKGVKEAKEWFKDKNAEYDIFGNAAQKYVDKVEERFNTIRILGMDKPVLLRNIYARVNILERITARHRATVEDLEKFFDRDNRSFGLVRKSKEGIEVVNELQKFIVLGKPGAGKTTFLKYIALQAIDDNLDEQRVPIFIGLKEWSDSGIPLMDYIVDQFDICDFPDARLFVTRMLSKGKCLLLLDGFDEVSNNVEDVITQIRRFSDKYSKNQFILSCRIAAYNYYFEKFSEVEIADFTSRQIETVINNWFGKGTTKAKLFFEEIKRNKSIRELANIPLLLTLLCIAFEETMEFPPNKAELYKEALDALLKKWDASRSIKRGSIYGQLSLKRKESMFSRIAASTFEKKQYFLPQRVIEKLIASYIQNLQEAREETLELDSEAILKEIEAQHGIFVERAKRIYSFSHLTFQEYFTARYLVDNASSGTIERLINEHLITDVHDDSQWREVFLLTAGMLEDADNFFLLMQERLNNFAHERLEFVLKEVQENIVKQCPPYSKLISRALALSYILQKSTSSIHYDVAKFFYTDPSLKDSYEARSDKYTIFERAIFVTRASDLIKNISQDHLSAITPYLKASGLLMDCLNSDCYVSKNIRQNVYDNMLMVI
jgi:predicted NACHT family NTPase